MKIIVCKSSLEAGSKVALEIKKQIENKPDSVLGLATGSTPIDTYKSLVDHHINDGLSFKNVKTVNLDEYVGLETDHDQSYRTFMNDHLFNKVDIDMENTHVPNGVAENLEEEAENYEKLIQDLGGQDIQILGVGVNGHIGFNEPNERLNIFTHVEDLDPSTIESNKRFFNDESEVPRQAISMGIGSIFKAKRLFLLAFGQQKAEAIKSLENSEISTQVPVTLLKLHPDVTVFIDEEAASKLNK